MTTSPRPMARMAFAISDIGSQASPSRATRVLPIGAGTSTGLQSSITQRLITALLRIPSLVLASGSY
jgi:hypothetical protein